MKRMAEGVFNCEVLIREIREQGYTWGKTILKDFVAPCFRKQFKITAVRRFETKPGEQMQADWGYLGTFLLMGAWESIHFCDCSWIFAISCCLLHQHHGPENFTALPSTLLSMAGGIAKQIVYDNMKTVTIGRDVGISQSGKHVSWILQIIMVSGQLHILLTSLEVKVK